MSQGGESRGSVFLESLEERMESFKINTGSVKKHGTKIQTEELARGRNGEPSRNGFGSVRQERPHLWGGGAAGGRSKKEGGEWQADPSHKY